ncbi:hypothetical protein BDW75DRAFT_221854 [Aspergillus navahoensis]
MPFPSVVIQRRNLVLRPFKFLHLEGFFFNTIFFLLYVPLSTSRIKKTPQCQAQFPCKRSR